MLSSEAFQACFMQKNSGVSVRSRVGGGVYVERDHVRVDD